VEGKVVHRPYVLVPALGELGGGSIRQSAEAGEQEQGEIGA
jgi:hypothetical protein